MPRINLLPWREGERKERKVAFAVWMGIAAVAACFTAFAVYLMFGTMIQAQVRRNDQLRVEIKTLDKQIEEINNLETAKQKFIARMKIIEQLQRSRPEIVHVFEEIVRTLPEGVYLTSVKQNASKLKFEGVAQSSTRVSSFMRNIDGSDWLKNPELEVVQTAKSGTTGSSFALSADEVSLAAQADDGNGNGKGGRKGAKGGKVMASNGGRQ